MILAHFAQYGRIVVVLAGSVASWYFNQRLECELLGQLLSLGGSIRADGDGQGGYVLEELELRLTNVFSEIPPLHILYTLSFRI